MLVFLVFAGESPGVEGVVSVPGPQDAGLGHGAGVCLPGLPRHADKVEGGQIWVRAVKRQLTRVEAQPDHGLVFPHVTLSQTLTRVTRTVTWRHVTLSPVTCHTWADHVQVQAVRGPGGLVSWPAIRGLQTGETRAVWAAHVPVRPADNGE